jgi:polysaccharide deacetylase family sporulation protein PdaB
VFVVAKHKNIKYALLMMLVMLLLGINFVGNTFATVYFGNVPRLVPIYCVDTPTKQVAITFDSAWGADKTQSIIDTLAEYGVSATFFLVGFWVEKYPQMVTALNEAGIEIGTHSNTHPDLTKLSAEQIQLELQTSVNLIETITNKPVSLFRPPFGAYNNTLINVATTLNLTTIQWDVDTLDWKGLSAMEITNRVLNKVKNGSIILCHNNADHIVEALPLILERLKMQGYEITSVGNLIMHENYYIDVQGTQKSK